MKFAARVKRNETGGYTALCPSLPGCISRGETKQEALEKLSECIAGYVAALGNVVPPQVDCEVLKDSG